MEERLRLNWIWALGKQATSLTKRSPVRNLLYVGRPGSGTFLRHDEPQAKGQVDPAVCCSGPQAGRTPTRRYPLA